jgi:hypothetical protein
VESFGELLKKKIVILRASFRPGCLPSNTVTVGIVRFAQMDNIELRDRQLKKAANFAALKELANNSGVGSI